MEWRVVRINKLVMVYYVISNITCMGIYMPIITTGINIELNMKSLSYVPSIRANVLLQSNLP